MIKRLLNYSPKEMLALSPQELLLAIRMSEGRVVIGGARVRGPNLVQYVTNAEVCAAFGCDIVSLNAHDLKNPYFPGLASKDPKDDEPFREIQVPIGRGWTAREIRELIGRPILNALVVGGAPAYGGEFVDTGFSDTKENQLAGAGNFATKENIELTIEQGFDILGVYGWAERQKYIDSVKLAREVAKDRIVIEAGVPHGPGLIYAKETPYNLRELITPDLAAELVEAGADSVHMPAVGSLPGYTPEYVGSIIDAVHEAGGLATVGIHSSQEGSDVQTIQRIAIDNKTLGADMYWIGDAGVNENMGLPEVINALCIAVKGHRHTYRRMSESVLR
jgi:hypothetical protein